MMNLLHHEPEGNKRRAQDSEENKNEKKVKAEEDQNWAFLRACKQGSLEDVKALLDSGADVLASYEEEGVSALHMACVHTGSYEEAERVVRLLISKQKALVRMVDDNASNVLHYAAQFSSAKICELLLKNGFKAINATDLNGRTPLMFACMREPTRRGRDEEVLGILKLLIANNAELMSKNKDGDTALHLACYHGTPEVVKLLLDEGRKRGIDQIDSPGELGQTPLMVACLNPLYGEAIIPLLCKAGADVTLKSENGDTAVNLAFDGGARMLKALAPFLPRRCSDLSVERSPPWHFPDPLGSYTVGEKRYWFKDFDFFFFF
jgi:ankyrin repeat protein